MGIRDLSNVREFTLKTKVHDSMLVLASDLHIGPPPRFRGGSESEWAQHIRHFFARVLGFCASEDCPLILAGDIFHQWDAKPIWVNLLIDALLEKPWVNVWVVAGNHDLPNHELAAMRRSALGTLVACGLVKLLSTEIPLLMSPSRGGHAWAIWGDSWGGSEGIAAKNLYAEKAWLPQSSPDAPISLFSLKDRRSLHVGHRFVYANPDQAPYSNPRSHAKTVARQCREAGHDMCFFGDNHQAFIWDAPRGSIINMGCAIPRTIDEQHGHIAVMDWSGGIHPFRIPALPAKDVEDLARTKAGGILLRFLTETGGSLSPGFEERLRERAQWLGPLAMGMLEEALDSARKAH